MIAEIISVGTELLLGNIVNTNANYLARQCATLGLTCYHQVTVGDNAERLCEAINQALSRADVILMTGGLGPTQDDLTKDTVAKCTKRSLIRDSHTIECIEKYFHKKGMKEIPENNYKQADIIEGCFVLENENGTAPGIILPLENGRVVILLPGPDYEMIPMFEKYVSPYFQKIQGKVICSKMIKMCGIAESLVEKTILDLINGQSNPTIATYAKQGEVHVRVTANANSKEEAKKLLKPVVAEIKQRFAGAVYTTKEEETLEDVVVKLLKKHNLTTTTAESCTGGMIASRIVNVSGASDVLKIGFVSYSNRAKKKYLDVNKETIKKYTEVSEQTVREMAKGVAFTTDSDTAIATTGYAGPNGGTDENPVGTVYISCYVNEKVVVERHVFNGNRKKVRELATMHALDLLRRTIIKQYE